MTSPAGLFAPVRIAVVTPPTPEPATEPSDLPLSPGDQGPDVASYQGHPNWEAVADSGYRFAFSKITEGSSYLNPFHAGNWDAMAILAVRGVYHFARPDLNSAEAEAGWFLQHLVLTRDTDIPVLDLEDGRGDLKQWTITWANRVAEGCGRKPLLYSGGPFMREHNIDNEDCAACFMGLWLAAYQQVAPPVPRGWESLLFWQHSDSTAIPGIQGACDCSTYRPV